MMRIFQPTIPLLTSLPATPVDEQLICYQPAAGLVQLLRYNLATTSWVSVDGKAAYSYSATRQGTHNGGNAGAGYVPLFCDTTERDPGGCGSTSGYTAKVAGRYLVTGGVRYSAFTAFCAIAVHKNGTQYREGNLISVIGGVTAHAIVQAAVNDLLTIYLYHGVATTGSALTAPNPADNWMQVELLDYL